MAENQEVVKPVVWVMLPNPLTSEVLHEKN